MSLSSKNILDSKICTGCLSVNRSISLLGDEHKIFFEVLLDPMVQYNNTPLLCWECMALMNRLKRFQKQVRTATEYLSSFMKTGSLSHLQLSETECISHNPSDVITESVITHGWGLPIRVKQECDAAPPQAVGSCTNYLTDGPTCDDDFKRENAAESTLSPDNFNDSDDEPLSFKSKIKSEDNDSILDSKIKAKSKKKRKNNNAKVSWASEEAGEGRGEQVLVNKKAARKLQQLGLQEGQVQLVCLSWEQVEEERQRTLASESFTRLHHKCYSCALGFNHRSKLENHMKKHDDAWGPERCSWCGVRCRDQRALHAHRRRHRLRWRCSGCGAAWSRAAVAADHCARAHGAPPPLHLCTLCPHRASTLGKLRVHMKSHGARQQCPQCDKTFQDRASLRTHLFIHRGEKEYACPRCDKRFLFKKAMEVHLVTHLDSAHLYCHECDLTFKNHMSYYGHMKYNLKHIDPAKLKHVCACGKRFAKQARLEEHRAAIHLKVTPFRCPAPGCGFASSSRPVLRAHSRSVHAARPAAAAAARNHVCHLCGKAYTTKKSLEGHLRAHAGSRPLRCARCPAAFAYHAALYNHARRVHKTSPPITIAAAAAADCRGSPPPPAAAAAAS